MVCCVVHMPTLSPMGYVYGFPQRSGPANTPYLADVIFADHRGRFLIDPMMVANVRRAAETRYGRLFAWLETYR